MGAADGAVVADPGRVYNLPMSFAARQVVKSWQRTLGFLRTYHRYEVVGMEYLPRRGPILVASTHSLATYENFLLGEVGQEVLGRRPYILADDLMFRVPVLGTALRMMSIVPGKRPEAMDILRRGDLLGLGPGGMREGLRGSSQRYQFDWEGRYGFVWVAMKTGTPVTLAACPGADDIYTVLDTQLTPWMYQQYHLPLPLFHGLGPTIMPKPVKLIHVLSEPIFNDTPPDEVTEDHVKAHHAYLVERMHELMRYACELSGLEL